MIIVRDLMLQLGFSVYLKSQVLQWDVVTVPIKEPSGLLGQIDITSQYMH